MTTLHRVFTFSAILFASCQNPSDESQVTESFTDTAARKSSVQDSSVMADYKPATDGMLIAPEMTRKLGDTLGIKFYEVVIKPGDSMGLHKHPDHIFYVVDGGRAAIYFGNERQEWDLKPGMGFVNGPVSDAGKNIGNTTIKVIVADIYRPRRND